MLTHHVALVSEESAISLSELTNVAGALQKQVTRDFAPLWGIEADVGAYGTLDDVPLDYWPIVIKDDIGDPSAAGYHQDDHGQPFSLVLYEQDWSLTASHELLEMLGDPFGRRMVAGQSPVASQGRVKFLVEVADPCEAAEFAYTINGVLVSDFYTPHYFDPVTNPSVRYSYQGSIKQPRQVLKGGYLSWFDPASGQWWQRTWFGNTPSDGAIKNLKITNGNLRAAIDRRTQAERAKAMRLSKRPKTVKADALRGRAKHLRSAIAAVSG